MTALQGNRDPGEGLGYLGGSLIVKNAAVLYHGALVGKNVDGEIQPMAPSVTGGLVCVGVNQGPKITGDGIERSEYRAGAYELHNSSSGDALTADDIGSVVYAADDQTVAKTSASGVRSVAGILLDVRPSGKCLTLVGLPFAPVSRTNAPTGVSEAVSLEKISSKAADAEVARFVAPYAGFIKSVRTVLNAALATGDATVTAKIGATAVTGGVVTQTQASSAAGDVDAASPTALNTFAIGDVISLTVGGASTATATFNATIELVRT